MRNFLLMLIFLSSCIVVVENGEKRERKKIPRIEQRKIALSSENIFLECPSGDLKIYGWENDSVDLNYEVLKGEGEIEFFEDKGEIRIKVINKTDNDFEVDMTVMVPYNSQIKIEMGGGKIFLENLAGETDVQLGAGSMEIKNSEGNFKIETGIGKVTGLFENRIPDKFMAELGLGEVEIVMDEYADLKFEAECGIGKVEVIFKFDEIQEKGLFIGSKFEGLKGEGVNDFKIDVGIGKISLFASE